MAGRADWRPLNKKAEQPASEKAFAVEVSSSSAIEQPVFESNSEKTLAEIREEAEARAKAARRPRRRTSGVRRLLRQLWRRGARGH